MIEADGLFAVLVDHFQHPRNHGSLEAPDVVYEDGNPRCGDRIRFHVHVNGRACIEDIRFVGDGCVISVAAASMLSTLVRGRSIHDALRLPEAAVLEALGAPISPRRYACALLGYRVLRAGLVQYVHEHRERGTHITSVVLAAGQSTRMGGTNKLLLPVDDGTLIERTVRAVAGAGLGEVIVVTGRAFTSVAAALSAYDVRVIENPEHAEGMAASIRTGVRAASQDSDGYVIVLGDMPFVRSETLVALADALREHPGSIIRPNFEGRRGNPLLFDRRYRHLLLGLQGDTGARSILEHHMDVIVDLDTHDPGILQDIDTPDDLEC